MRTTLAAISLIVGCLFDGAAAHAGDEYVVKLSPGKAGSRLAPRYSPKGYRIPLTPMKNDKLEGLDHRQGRLQLGPKDTRGAGHLIVLARSVAAKPFDLLWIDTRGDGSVDNDEVQRVTSRTSRGSVYTSFQANVRVNHGSVETPAWETFPIGLWVAVAGEDVVPAFIRFSRRGFLVGSVTLGETKHDVVLSDANNDAILGTGDWWSVVPADGKSTVAIAASRKVGDFAWVGTKAYKLVLTGTAGRLGRIVPFDPGITPEEDAKKRDPLWDDKRAERAKTPLAFGHEVDGAIKEARSKGAAYYLDFETDWCGPCKQMDRWVYTAKDVVAAAKGIVCIKVDGDKRKDLKEAKKVSAFPTGILYDAAGEEVARFTGYRTVKQMVDFFAKARAIR